MLLPLPCCPAGFSVWGIASQAKNDLLYKFMNVTLPVLDLSACPKSFCAANTTAGAPIVVPSGNSTLAAYGQCGGAGGECAKWGFCDDRPFPAYSCLSGWSCQRQHRWYYQCLPATGLIPSATGCDFSAFGEPLATMMSGLGMICTLKSGLMSFALNPLAVPKMIDPFAMLQVFNGAYVGGLAAVEGRRCLGGAACMGVMALSPCLLLHPLLQADASCTLPFSSRPAPSPLHPTPSPTHT